MLVPETVEVLGGMVQELDAARQRLVNEVNKPPRGKRYSLSANSRFCDVYTAFAVNAAFC